MELITIFGIESDWLWMPCNIHIMWFLYKRHVLECNKCRYSFAFQAGMTSSEGSRLPFRNAMQLTTLDSLWAFNYYRHQKDIEAYKENGKTIVLTGMTMLITLAVATSIDALAAGLSFSTLNKDIILPMIIIGIIALVFSFGGVYLGKAVRSVGNFGRKIDMIGGIIL